MNDQIVLIALLFFFTISTFPENYPLKTSRIEYRDKILHGIVFNIGTPFHVDHSEILFFFDLAFPDILIPEKSKHRDGIICDDKNSCEISSFAKHKYIYLYKELEIIKGKSHFSTDEEIDHDVSLANPIRSKVDLHLIVGGDDWSLKNWGVFGLAQKSAMSEYLLAIEKSSLRFILAYTDIDVEVDFKMYLNPSFNKEHALTSYNIDRNNKYWEVIGDLNFGSNEKLNLANQVICINSISANIFQFKARSVHCHAIQRIICNGKVGKDCTREIGIISKAPKISIKVNNAIFSFDPDEYLYYEEGEIMCRFGSFDSIHASNSCGPETKIGIGKRFMEKYPIIFTLGRNAPNSVLFLSKFLLPQTKSRFFKYYISLGLILTILGAIVVVLSIRKKEKEQSKNGNLVDQPLIC